MTERPQIPADPIKRTEHLFAQMNPPLAKVLSGLLVDLEVFSDLVAKDLEPGFDEFDGFSGIEAHGDVANLLSSEWLLYDINRTEFLRRVVENEALYRRKTYHSSAQGRSINLVVDAGAYMLGHNRLLGLGAIFWLSSVAARQKLEFSWASTAHRENWYSDLNKETVSQYLGSVAQTELDQNSLEQIMLQAPSRDCSKKSQTKDFWILTDTRSKLDLSVAKVGFRVDLPMMNEDGRSSSQLSFFSSGLLRRKTKIDFPEDGQCIGAIRRPFKLIPSEPSSSNSHLRAHWYATHWLDTPSGHIFVRWKEGLLILPKLDGEHQENVWIPTPEKLKVVGLCEHNGIFQMMWFCEDRGKSINISSFNLRHLKRSAKYSSYSIEGLDFDLNFEIPALPWQDIDISGKLENGNSIFDASGRAFTCDAGGHLSTKKDEPRLLAIDGRNLLLVSTEYRHALAHKNGTNHRELRMYCDDPDDWSTTKRDIRLATSDIAAMWSSDGVNYNVQDRNQTQSLELPKGLVPIQMLGTTKGYGYIPDSGEIVQYTLRAGKPAIGHPQIAVGRLSGLEHVRSAFWGRAAYGVIMKNGNIEDLVHIRLSGKKRSFTPTSISKAIETARTVWLLPQD
jgi:hypothetical protein